MQELVRNRYANNKETAKTINRVSALNAREAAREYVYQYLLENPCGDCGEDNPVVLTFDHVRGEKKLGISDMVGRGWSLETIKAEIRKCEVVCFNCHMRREYNRRR
jgi:ArsR family metal-binding transcriptional regulator